MAVFQHLRFENKATWFLYSKQKKKLAVNFFCFIARHTPNNVKQEKMKQFTFILIALFLFQNITAQEELNKS